jgi:2-methylaconitate cis-trans-isomerase PrpF
VAALLPAAGGGLSARAVSVPSWHPTLALTGGICLGAATLIDGTVAWRLARDAGYTGGPLSVRTPGGSLRVIAQTLDTGTGGPRELAWVSVAGKQVHYRGPADLPDPFAMTTMTREPGCQPIPW